MFCFQKCYSVTGLCSFKYESLRAAPIDKFANKLHTSSVICYLVQYSTGLISHHRCSNLDKCLAFENVMLLLDCNFKYEPHRAPPIVKFANKLHPPSVTCCLVQYSTGLTPYIIHSKALNRAVRSSCFLVLSPKEHEMFYRVTNPHGFVVKG